MAEQEFKFPDEIEKQPPKAAEDDLKVEIVDDTPPEDRGRQPMPKELVDDLESDNLEEYSEKVRKRLSQLKKVFHDERRAKEQAARERDEAATFAAHQYKQNQELKQRLGAGEQIFKSEVTRAAETEAAAAKERLKAAYESGDAQKIADAQEALTEAKLRQNDWSKFQPSSVQRDDSGVQTTQQISAPAPVAPQVDRKALAWRDRNTWFGEPGKEEMTALALGLHEKLVRNGVDPNSDEYYDHVDRNMRKRFPDQFKEEVSTSQPEPKPEPRKNSTNVAPASRSSAPRQIRLTATQAALAKRLGITPEAYAREQIKLENANG